MEVCHEVMDVIVLNMGCVVLLVYVSQYCHGVRLSCREYVKEIWLIQNAEWLAYMLGSARLP